MDKEEILTYHGKLKTHRWNGSGTRMIQIRFWVGGNGFQVHTGKVVACSRWHDTRQEALEDLYDAVTDELWRKCEWIEK